MKPRLKLFRGAWHCYVIGSGSFHSYCGLGPTPKDAWLDWAVLQMLRTEAKA